MSSTTLLLMMDTDASGCPNCPKWLSGWPFTLSLVTVKNHGQRSEINNRICGSPPKCDQLLFEGRPPFHKISLKSIHDFWSLWKS